MRFLLLLLTLTCCGKILDDADAGDAATSPDGATEASSDEGGAPGTFACGETGHFVHCDPTTQYCRLIKTSHARDYSCQTLPPPPCATTASSPYECGCFQSGSEIFVTDCQ